MFPAIRVYPFLTCASSHSCPRIPRCQPGGWETMETSALPLKTPHDGMIGLCSPEAFLRPLTVAFWKVDAPVYWSRYQIANCLIARTSLNPVPTFFFLDVRKLYRSLQTAGNHISISFRCLHALPGYIWGTTKGLIN